MTTNDDNTVTKTELEAVEKTYKICPWCEQEYPESEMVTVCTRPEPVLDTRNRHVDVRFGKLWSTPVSDLQNALSVTVASKAEICPHCADQIGVYGGTRNGGPKLRPSAKQIGLVISGCFFLVLGTFFIHPVLGTVLALAAGVTFLIWSDFAAASSQYLRF